MNRTQILIVDDNPVIRETVALILEIENDLEICGEAQSISEALEQCALLQPDLAMVDLSLKGEDGLDLIRRLKECAPAVQCIVFSLHDESCYIDGAREAGARGYAIKSSGFEALLSCIHRVRDGQSSFATPGPL